MKLYTNLTPYLEDLYERGLNRSFMELKPDHALELEFVGVS